MNLTFSLLLTVFLSQSAPPAPPAPPSPPAPPASEPAPPAPVRTTPGTSGSAERNLQTGARKATPPSGSTAPARPATPPDREPEVDEDGYIDSLPPLEAEPKVLDFGFIPPREKAKGAFKLWNRGDKPLRIMAVQPSCKCTTTNDVTDKDIAPGEFVELDAEFEESNFPQPRKATIKILVDGYQRVMEIEMRGEVAYAIRSLPSVINVVSGQAKSGRFVIESIDKKPFRICNIHGEAPDYINFDPAADEPRASYVLKWDVTKYGDAPPGHWVVETDRADCPTLPVRLRHESNIPKPTFKLKQYNVNLGRVPINETVEVDVEMEDPGEPILTVAAISEFARAEMTRTEVIEGVMHVHVRITPKKDHEGLLHFPLVIYSPTREMEVETFGVVRPEGSACKGS